MHFRGDKELELGAALRTACSKNTSYFCPAVAYIKENNL